MKKAVNKLSIYLIKDEYSKHSDILKDYTTLESKKINGIGSVYFGESASYAPSWIGNFFGDALKGIKLFNASAKAILMIEIAIDAKNKRLFAMPFGYGHTMLIPGTWEERFGLKTTLSVIESDRLRKIDKKNMSSVPKDTSEQLSRAGIVADFGVDIEQDLIRSITGGTNNEAFGRTVSGKDSLSISTRVDIVTIMDFLRTCYERYTSDDYKKNFGWIDQIAELKSPKLKDKLNQQMLEFIKNENLDRTWMAVPELVDWANVAGFSYKQGKLAEKYDDINLLDFLKSLGEDAKTNLEVTTLKSREITCISASNDEVMHRWKAYNCVYCEIVDESTSKTYLLSNGKWYEVEKDFAKQVNDDYSQMRSAGSSLSLPAYQHKNEGEYNKGIAEQDAKYCCMDKKLIGYGGGHSSIEFCDLLTKDREIIHVKRYGGSSVLSHLFSQGVVSGELFLAESGFREKVNAQLSDSHKLTDCKAKPNAEDYQVIFAVISAVRDDLEIPFFSKVSLRVARRRLETYGYKVSLTKILADKSDENGKT